MLQMSGFQKILIILWIYVTNIFLMNFIKYIYNTLYCKILYHKNNVNNIYKKNMTIIKIIIIIYKYYMMLYGVLIKIINQLYQLTKCSKRTNQDQHLKRMLYYEIQHFLSSKNYLYINMFYLILNLNISLEDR